MTAPVRLARLAAHARRRRVADDALIALPLALAAAAFGWRLGGVPVVIAAGFVAIAAVIAIMLRRAARIDRAWIVRRLDAARGDLDDSADLLFADNAALSPLARLQRTRIERRLVAGEMPDLRPAWSAQRIALAWLAALAVAAALLVVPRGGAPGLAPSRDAGAAFPGVPRLVGQRLRIVPPAYTGLPPRDAGLDARAPAGSRLDWTLAFAPQPAAASLVFADGTRAPLTRAGDAWTAGLTLTRSVLYRVVPAGGGMPPLHRLDAVAAAPPQVRVIAPDRGLSLVTSGQRRWPLVFAATDDYGVAPVAQLHLTIAAGEGETVKFREALVPVRGTGPATARRFATAVDLAALQFAAGSDLVAQLVVTDNRAAGPQTARSASVILRWSAADGEGVGREGVVTRAMPAYFRSERQIIIDAEALIKDRPHVSADRFLARSDAIGADQRLLRLRYGQFLGEEQEGTRPPPPTADAPTADAPPAEGDGKPTPPQFGAENQTLETYGHVHDEAEAATLLDPDTRATLKAALDAMWQAELNLRQGAPTKALPFAYVALGKIKAVQQATRIFLARVGPDLPPIDESRRLTGKRDGITRRDLPSAAATPLDATPAAVWRGLAEPGGGDPARLAALDGWARANPTTVADPLALAAAIDAVRRDPACDACRRALRGVLWSALPRPAAGVVPRASGDDSGRRYLDAMRTQ